MGNLLFNTYRKISLSKDSNFIDGEWTSLCFYSDFLKTIYSEAHFPYAFIPQILDSLSMTVCLTYFMIMINQNFNSNSESNTGFFYNLSSNSTALAIA